MSWTAYLVDTEGPREGEWNYTHNCNGMIEAALGAEVEATGQPFWATLGNLTMGRYSWWILLDGLGKAEGVALLDPILRGLESDPDRYRAMNPANGWGSYDELLEILREMRNAAPAGPCTWRVFG